MPLSSLPLEIDELIFSLVVWDDFSPETVSTLNSASDCIDRIHQRNRQLAALKRTARFVESVVKRLSYKYLHIASQAQADAVISAVDEGSGHGALVRHLFLGDKLGRYHRDNAPNFTWNTTESAKKWVDAGTLGRLLQVMPGLVSLHIHLPGIHSQLFSSNVLSGREACPPCFASIRCLSLYDDVNNTYCYEPVRSLKQAQSCLSAFVNLEYLIVSESEGLGTLDCLIGSSPLSASDWYGSRLKKVMLEKWLPMGSDIILYNLAMQIPFSDLTMIRKVPRRLSMAGIFLLLSLISH